MQKLEAELDDESRQELDSIFQGLRQTTTPMRDRTNEGTSTLVELQGLEHSTLYRQQLR
jgi:hypothetical protein